jgi:hypothetical protein
MPDMSITPSLNATIRVMTCGVAPAVMSSALIAACSGDQENSSVIQRDSAGVKIVESYQPAWAEGEGWRLSQEPIVTIGVEEGPEEYSLYQVAAALRLPDGRIVIHNNGSDQLRYYDSTGTHLYSVGRDGFGPGEFKRVLGMWLAGDSLIVNDWGQDRVSVFSAGGEYGRTVMLYREPGPQPVAVGVFPDGSILGRELVYDRAAVPDSGLQLRRWNAVYRRYARDGAVIDSIGVFLWHESLSETLRRELDSERGGATSYSVAADAPFGRQGSTLAFGDHVYHGSSDTYEIRVFDSHGTLERIIRRPIPNAPVTGSDMEAFKQDFIGDEDSPYAKWARRRVNELRFPETKPAYGTVKVDALGNIWVAEYSLGHNDRSGNWTVFDSDGCMLGDVVLSVDGRITEIGADYLLGVWRTELGVEQVKMYRLLKE